MAQLLRFALPATCVAALIIACSSSSSDPIPSGPNSGDGSTSNDPDSTAAQSDGATTPPADGSTGTPDGSTGVFTLSSTAIKEGASFPAENTCTGTNVSPPFTWTSGPAAAKSYALVLNDTTISFLHFIVYDIPPTVMSLPASIQAAYAPAIPAGAHETKNYKGQLGYAGPCPPQEHVYEFVLYALDVAALPGAAPTLSLANAETAIKAHMIASTKLTAKYKQP